MRPRTDLVGRKFDMKQIFPDTARQPKAPPHIKEQTDGRISQTIFRIQSNQAKRDFSQDFLFVILTASTPRLRIILLGRKTYPSLQATCCHRGDASAQRAAPGRAEFLQLALRRAPVRRKFRHFSVCEPISALTNRPCRAQIRCQTNFPRHRAPTTTTSTYQTTS